jgi:hypothetical protein
VRGSRGMFVGGAPVERIYLVTRGVGLGVVLVKSVDVLGVLDVGCGEQGMVCSCKRDISFGLAGRASSPIRYIP